MYLFIYLFIYLCIYLFAARIKITSEEVEVEWKRRRVTLG